jgi:hypothetical protein
MLKINLWLDVLGLMNTAILILQKKRRRADPAEVKELDERISRMQTSRGLICLMLLKTTKGNARPGQRIFIQ